MASVRKEIQIDAGPDAVWDAVRDLAHYNATVTVSPSGDSGSRIDWVVDVLPNELEPILSQVMNHGAAAMKATLDG